MPPVSFPSTVGLEFEWLYPNSPPEISYQLLELEEYLEDTGALMVAAQHIAQADIERRFIQEEDPDGKPWEPLVSPADNQIGILRLTGEMFKRAKSDAAWEPTEQGVFFRTDMLPDYWVFHEQPEGGGGQRIPQRRFIGLSADSQREIEILADAWVETGIVQATTRTGGVGRIKGRFVPLMHENEANAPPGVARATSGKFAKKS